MRYILGRKPVNTRFAQLFILTETEIFLNPNVNAIGNFLGRRTGEQNRIHSAEVVTYITPHRHLHDYQSHSSYLRDPHHPFRSNQARMPKENQTITRTV